MSERVGPGRPPVGSRFRKGESGNPKGRPKARLPARASVFDMVIDRTVAVAQNGKVRELTLEEALHHNTYQDAIAGSRTAQREVLKMIEKWEKWFAAKTPKFRPPELRSEPADAENANQALLLLDIVERDTRWDGHIPDNDRLLLRTWAAQAALSRSGRRQLSPTEISEIKRCTAKPEKLRWPRGVSDEQDS